MNEFKMKFLPVILTAASVAFAAENNPEINRAVNRIDVGRQEVDERGGALVRSGNELFADGQYLKARDKYLAAIKVYEPFAAYGSFHEKSEYCRKRIGDCYYQMAVVAMRKADELAQSRDYDEAIKECREALKFCEKEQQDELNRLIEVYEKRRDNAVERESASVERQIPNIKEQEYQIQVLMEQGRKLALNREYGRAARKFQEALLINPFNGEALQCLRAVNDRIGEIGHRRFVNEHRRQLGELEWKSAIPYRKSGEDEAQNLLDSAAPKRKPEKRGNELSKRLAEIKLPRVNLPEYTVAEVVEYIRTESVRHDPAKLGVNIVFLRSGRKAAAENTANNDAPSDGPTDDGTQQNRQANPGNTEVPATEERITLDIKNDSIINVLDKLCSATRSPQMRYQIDDNAVLISPVDVDLGGLQTDTIQINLDEGVTDEDLKTGMLSQGIKFSPGAAVTYNAKLGRVVIRNDSENLNKMRAFLETKKKNEGAMIQLQIKLVEMMQEDIDELAFNWQYAVNANQSYYTDGRSSVTPLSGGPRELTRASIIQSSSNELMRYYVPDNHTTTQLEDATYSFMWANSDGTKITANMFALDWADSKDALASPRITTLPGHTAKIEMVTIRYFPEDWETIDVDQGIVNGEMIERITPQPNLDKEKKLGPVFEMRPQIIPGEGEGDERISVDINFPIETFADEWIIYGSPDAGDDDDYIQMPVFNTRKISCKVILGDGETIVLGGLGRDDTITTNDKIPILGDLPVIGRLFQSKYSDASKVNVLIFLTGRLVKPDGSAYNPKKQIQRGLPRFGRVE